MPKKENGSHCFHVIETLQGAGAGARSTRVGVVAVDIGAGGTCVGAVAVDIGAGGTCVGAVGFRIVSLILPMLANGQNLIVPIGCRIAGGDGTGCNGFGTTGSVSNTVSNVAGSISDGSGSCVARSTRVGASWSCWFYNNLFDSAHAC